MPCQSYLKEKQKKIVLKKKELKKPRAEKEEGKAIRGGFSDIERG